MSDLQLDDRLTIAAVLDSWPETAEVFLKRRMACVGCDLSGFETLAEAAHTYRIDPAHLLADLSRAIAAHRQDGISLHGGTDVIAE